MAFTKFGIVYAIGSAQVRRFIYPTLSDAEIAVQPLAPGEAIALCSRGPYASNAQWQAAITAAVTAAAGKAPGNPRCCVVDPQGHVVNVILADPALDSVTGMILVSSLTADIGWTWTAQGGFVAPPPTPIPLGAPGNRP